MNRPTACEVPQVPSEVMDTKDHGLHGDAEGSNSSLLENEVGEGVYVFPASLEQIRYWTLDQLDHSSSASNMAIAARLEGLLNDHLVERAVEALVVRHEALRTTFRIIDGQLSQVISELAQYRFEITDLRTLPDSDRDAAAEVAVEEHSHARASLETGPLFFVRLIHLTDVSHVLALTMHHIVCDGWSNGILIRDFTDIYTALTDDRDPALADLPFQFADFTVWQQNWLESRQATEALQFWSSHIKRDLPAVDLPRDAQRLPQKSYPGRIESVLLPDALTAKLKAYCRTKNATMHQVLLAAFEALISRYSGQEEYLLGSTIANRTQPGMENVVGRFANPQVILADVNGDPSFEELLKRVSDWSAEAYAHQDLPFSRLMEAFQLDQAGATSQFLQVYFVYQKAFMQPQTAPGLKVIPRPSVSGGVNFDLLVSIVERAEGPRLQMEYNTLLFQKERIVGLISMYVRVLEAVMQDDSLRVSDLPLGDSALASVETGVLEPDRLSAEPSLAPDLSISEWIDQNAETLSDSTAILEGDRTFSWQQVRQRSLMMMETFGAMGVTSGSLVALRIEPNAYAAAAAWALMRMGAIALPIASSANLEEWSRLLSQHRPVLALTSANFSAGAPSLTPYEKLLDLATSSVSPLAPKPSATAWFGLSNRSEGSTKVACTHHDTSVQMLSAAKALDLSMGDSVLIFPADGSTDAWTDLLLPMVAGATIIYAGDSKATQAASLLNQHQVSYVFTSPTHLLSATRQGWHGDRRINVVVRGGILNAGQIATLAKTPSRLWNLISAAEASGPLAIARVLNTSDLNAHLPRFTAIGTARLAVFDKHRQIVPAGVEGELGVQEMQSNPSLTGYLARLAPKNGARDILHPGSLEILDTVTRLVRLHGYRLRLSEVEEILWQDDDVADVRATLSAVEEAPILVAYVVPIAKNSTQFRDIAARFKRTAPGHLATAELVAVEGFHYFADGSVDFSRLPAPGSAVAEQNLNEDYLAPRDELESSLVGIWEEVLGVKPIGVRSSFFKLGGYSLMIVRLFARINKVLGTALPITTIFNAPTVEQLADIVRGRAYYSSLVPVQPSGNKPPFFMVHSYLLYRGLPAVMGNEYPFYGLREMDTDAENMTVEERAAAYLDGIRSIQPKGPYYIGGWCAAGPLAVEIARQIIASGESVGFLVLFDSWRPGYAAEVAQSQAGSPEMSLRARLDRKFRFHRKQWRKLTPAQRLRYLTDAVGKKISSVRNRIYLKNWAMAERLRDRFGLQLPHFMHNVSLTTLNSLKEYRGVEPYPGSLTLIRAKEAPYIPGAQEHCGWDAIVKGGVNVLWADGDHESMFLEPHLQKVGELLRVSLTEAYNQNGK